MNTIHFGIIGAGNIAQKFTKACASVEAAQVVAVASTNKERGDAFAQEFSIPASYGSYEEIVADPKVDAIYIAVINHAHIRAIELAARAGKAILCEKPCVVNQEQWDLVTALIKEYDILFMEAMWSLHLPVIQKAKEWVDSGKIGQLKTIESSFSFHSERTHERLYSKEFWGGGLLDVGVYCIAFTCYMADGFPLDVKGMEYIGETGVDEYGTLMMRFPDNIITTSYYGVHLHRDNGACISGELGRIEIKEFWNGESMALYDNKDNLLETFEQKHENGFVYEVAHFAQLFLEGKKESPINTLKASETYIQIYETVRAQR